MVSQNRFFSLPTYTRWTVSRLLARLLGRPSTDRSIVVFDFPAQRRERRSSGELLGHHRFSKSSSPIESVEPNRGRRTRHPSASRTRLRLVRDDAHQLVHTRAATYQNHPRHEQRVAQLRLARRHRCSYIEIGTRVGTQKGFDSELRSSRGFDSRLAVYSCRHENIRFHANLRRTSHRTNLDVVVSMTSEPVSMLLTHLP
jgi:hypothetical protein